MTDGKFQQILPGKEISDSKDVILSVPVKPVLGIQLAPRWSDETNLGSWRLAWSHGWSLSIARLCWPEMLWNRSYTGTAENPCVAPGCQHSSWWLSHICLPLGLLLSPACLPVLLHCCYFISIKPNKTKYCNSFFLPVPLLVWPIHQSPLHFIFAISAGTACPSHASHTNGTSNHENIRIFKDWHKYRLDRYFPFPYLATVFPGNYIVHILGCWIRGDWAEGRSEHQWHDLTLTVKENSTQVTRNGTMQKKAIVTGLYWIDNLLLFNSSVFSLHGNNMLLLKTYVKYSK